MTLLENFQNDKALALIEKWESRVYQSHCQKKAALQVAIIEALQAETERCCDLVMECANLSVGESVRLCQKIRSSK